MLFGAVLTELQLAQGIQPHYGEQRHGVGNPENLVGNNYTCRQCCQDMEVLFSDFHIGNVWVGVVGGCLGHHVVHEVGGLLPELKNKKKPCKLVFTGHGSWHGGSGGLAWLSVG